MGDIRTSSIHQNSKHFLDNSVDKDVKKSTDRDHNSNCEDKSGDSISSGESDDVKYENENDKPESSDTAFEEILNICGDSGCFQFRIFLLTSFCGFLTALHNLGFAFLGAAPDHWCNIGIASSSSVLSESEIKERVIPRDSNGKFDKCHQYHVTNFTTLAVDASTTESCKQYIYDHSEFETTIPTEWNLVCDKESYASSVQGLYMLGILFGSTFFGLISDRYGRKCAIFLSSIIFTVSAPLVALSPNYISLIVIRFILGFSSPGIYGTSFVLAVEYIGLKWRGAIGNLFCLPFAFGYMALAGFAYFIRNWRHLQYAISAPALIQLIICFFLYESPRWLLRKGRVERAEKVLRKVAQINGKEQLIPTNFTEMLVSISREDTRKLHKKVGFKSKLHEFFQEYIGLFKTPRIRIRTLVLYFCWMSVSMVYYGIALNAPNLSTNLYLYTMIGGALEIPSYLMVPPLITYFGRRFTFTGFFLISGFSLLISLAFNPQSAMVVGLALVGKLLIGSAYALIYLYATELFPTLLRASAVGSACMFGHIGSTISPYIVSGLGKSNNTYPAIVFGTLSVLSGLLALLLPETRNKKLPEGVSDIEIPNPKQ